MRDYKSESLNNSESRDERKESRNIFEKMFLFMCKLLCVITIPIFAFFIFIFTSVGIVVKVAGGFIGTIATLLGIMALFQFGLLSMNNIATLFYFGIGFLSFIVVGSVDVIAVVFANINSTMITFLRS